MVEHALTWVLVDGEPRRVSEFAHLPPRRRPRAICPECARPLTLKLGRILRHHAAHAPQERCAATNPETALHVDVKFHLARELSKGVRGREPLVIARRCASCDAEHDDDWLEGWEEVLIEHRVAGVDASRRPDVVLRRGGRAVAAIEVRASHAVSEEKSRALATLGVPWVEVRASVDLIDGENAWSLARPLVVSGSSAPWRCAEHALTTTLRASRVVDVYHAAGLRDRVIYRIDEQRDAESGDLAAVVLRRDGREVCALPVNPAAAQSEAFAKLRVAFAEDVARLAERAGSFTDSPMRWAEGDVAASLVEEAFDDTGLYDPTPLVSRYPRRWFFARERGEWFLPRDMQDVRWDRENPDAFAPHEAWATSRAAVRERPVPEHAWSTTVFARRPTATMFGFDARVTMATPTIAIVDAGGHKLLVLTQATPEEAVRRVAAELAAAGEEHLWLSHPLDWSRTRGDLAWAASGCDARGRGLVVVDGVGVYRAAPFLSAFARADRRLEPEVVRAHMAERVEALPSR